MDIPQFRRQLGWKYYDTFANGQKISRMKVKVNPPETFDWPEAKDWLAKSIGMV
jgi:hypothetical protein